MWAPFDDPEGALVVHWGEEFCGALPAGLIPRGALLLVLVVLCFQEPVRLVGLRILPVHCSWLRATTFVAIAWPGRFEGPRHCARAKINEAHDARGLRLHRLLPSRGKLVLLARSRRSGAAGILLCLELLLVGSRTIATIAWSSLARSLCALTPRAALDPVRTRQCYGTRARGSARRASGGTDAPRLPATGERLAVRCRAAGGSVSRRQPLSLTTNRTFHDKLGITDISGVKVRKRDISGGRRRANERYQPVIWRNVRNAPACPGFASCVLFYATK